MPERGHHVRVLHARAYDAAERRALQQEPQTGHRHRREQQHHQPVLRIDEVAGQDLTAQQRRNRERDRCGAEHDAQRLLDDHREAEGQQQSERRIVAIEAPEQEALDDETDDRHQHRRGDERTREADVVRQHHGEVRAQRIERAVGEIDEPTQRKDERQAERDQQVIRADQQAIDDLLDDLGEDHRQSEMGSELFSRIGSPVGTLFRAGK